MLSPTHTPPRAAPGAAGEHGGQGQKLGEEGSFLLDSNSMFRWVWWVLALPGWLAAWLAAWLDGWLLLGRATYLV